jgi:Ca-activated chloride channel homolog
MTFYEAGTNTVRYNYLHTINHRGNPDTLVLDPDSKYDLVVHTIPPVEKKDVSIIKGKHNVIPLDAPQGFLKLELDGYLSKYYPTTIIRKSGEMKTLNVQDFGKAEKYLVGKYDLEVLTLPRIYVKDVEIKQSSINSIKIPTSGSVLFSRQTTGFGSIYVDDGKTVAWVCNFNKALQNEVIYLQPGKYKAVFRPEFAKETLKTVERNFEVKSGTAIAIKLF